MPRSLVVSLRVRLKRFGLGAVFKVVAGNGGYVVLGFLANILAANGLDPTGFGLMSLGLAVLNVLQEICGNGIDLAMVRLAAPYVGSEPRVAARFFRAAFQLKLIVNGAIAICLWFLAETVALSLYGQPELVPFVQWVCVGLVGAALYNYVLAKFQTEERFTLYAAMRVLSNVVKLLALGLLFVFDALDPQNVMASWMCSFFIGFGIALLFNRHRTQGPEVDVEDHKRYWQEIVRFGGWVVASSFLFTLYSRTDLLLLGRFADADTVGNYAVAWNITFVIDLLTYSVIIALLPRASRMTEGLELRRLAVTTVLICGGLAMAMLPLYLLADWFFGTLFTHYHDSARIFRILFWGALVTLIVHPMYLILYARNRVNRLTFVNLILAIFSLLVGLAVIPEYGAVGAAGVTVAGRVVASVLILGFVISEIRNKSNV